MMTPSIPMSPQFRFETPPPPYPPDEDTSSLHVPSKNARNTSQNPAEVAEQRGHWGSRAEFLLSCVGYSIGLGNVWRFPFLAYQNGGGAFLIPYVIILLVVGKPMYFMEAALGQFAQVGPLTIWLDMLPCGLGVGMAMIVLCFMVSIYYNVIMAYCLHYLFNCFRASLPWASCSSHWGADSRCYTRNSSFGLARFAATEFCLFDEQGYGCTEVQPQTAAEQYWNKGVLGLKEDGLKTLGDLGEIQMDLAFCLLLAWLVVNMCLIKGVKSSGKAVYLTATLPYLMLFLLFIRGVTLPGAMAGIRYLFLPDWRRLQDLSVWRNAAAQVFFSLGISWGGIIMMGSYNKFNARVHVDTHLVATLDFLTSLLAGTVIFSLLGHSAHVFRVPVSSVARGGQGLAFIAYPEALALLPGAHIWAIIFFTMMFSLGLDSQFAQVEVILVGLCDTFPRLRSHKAELATLLCGVCFLLGLPCITQRGQYVIDLMDTYGASLSVIFVAIAEIIFVMWFYGVQRFCKDLTSMLGFTPGWYFKLCWALVSPLLLIAVFIGGILAWQKPTYNGLHYPDWAHKVGLGLALSSILQIPLWFFLQIAVKIWRRRPILEAFQPSKAWKLRRNGPADRPGGFAFDDSDDIFRGDVPRGKEALTTRKPPPKRTDSEVEAVADISRFSAYLTTLGLRRPDRQVGTLDQTKEKF